MVDQQEIQALSDEELRGRLNEKLFTLASLLSDPVPPTQDSAEIRAKRVIVGKRFTVESEEDSESTVNGDAHVVSLDSEVTIEHVAQRLFEKFQSDDSFQIAVRGIQGANGVKGETGIQGLKGLQGLQGEKGDTGTEQGEKGENGTPGDDRHSTRYVDQNGFDVVAP